MTNSVHIPLRNLIRSDVDEQIHVKDTGGSGITLLSDIICIGVHASNSCPPTPHNGPAMQDGSTIPQKAAQPPPRREGISMLPGWIEAC